MADPTKTEPKTMTAADAAKRVKRTVVKAVLDKDGKPLKDADGNPKFTTQKLSVAADEVLSFKDYGDYVVVVTIDGQKFSSADAAE